jgi:translation initiation factor IF-1
VNSAATGAAAAAIDRWRNHDGEVRVNRTPPFFFISPAMNPTKEDHIEIEGRITTVLPGTMFRVELDNKHLVLATVCGKMRKRWVRLTTGDRVKMEMSPYDLNKARITWRLK